MAIQVATQLGARVAVTAGSADKLEACRALGADVLVNYRDDDFVARVREETDGRGADVVLDVIGAKYLARNIEVLARDGRLVVIGLQGGTKAEVDLGAMLAKRATLHATALRSRSLEAKAGIVAQVREHLWPWVASGAVKPIVHGTFPLAQAGRAQQVMEDSSHVGKLLLTT